MEIPTTIYLTYFAIQKCKFKDISPMFFSMLAAIPIGTIFLVSIDEKLIKITMSILVIFFVILIAKGWRLKLVITKYVLIIGGTISGLMQGATGMGGPPYATILLSKGDNDDLTRGNILIMGSGLVLSALLSIYYFNLFTKEVVLIGVIASPFYIFSSFIGSKFYYLSGNKYYRNISLFVLGLIGAGTLIISFFEN
jgi:uncharacterized membrane protein YfcA|tara:strand:- start:183 stop:770 length:588 start_codon:yes stop_codon:yes gene_type:complete